MVIMREWIALSGVSLEVSEFVAGSLESLESVWKSWLDWCESKGSF